MQRFAATFATASVLVALLSGCQGGNGTSSSNASRDGTGPSVLTTRMQTALRGAGSVNYTNGELNVKASTKPTFSGTGQLALGGELTGSFKDSSLTPTDVTVVAGVPYVYDSLAKTWMKRSDSPGAVERQFFLGHASRICQNDPRVIADLVSTGTATNRAKQSVNGVETTHWEVRSTKAAVMDAMAAAMKAHGCDTLADPAMNIRHEKATAMGGNLPYTFDVFLDSSDRLVMYYEPKNRSGDDGRRNFIRYSGFGQPLKITVPHAAKPYPDVPPTVGPR